MGTMKKKIQKTFSPKQHGQWGPEFICSIYGLGEQVSVFLWKLVLIAMPTKKFSRFKEEILILVKFSQIAWNQICWVAMRQTVDNTYLKPLHTQIYLMVENIKACNKDLSMKFLSLFLRALVLYGKVKKFIQNTLNLI